MSELPSWRDLASAYDWRPIPGCPGRFVLCGGKSALHPASFVAGATVWPERRVPGARDPVVVVPLAEPVHFTTYVLHKHQPNGLPEALQRFLTHATTLH